MNSEAKSFVRGCSGCVAEAIALGDLERLKWLLALDGVRYSDEFWAPTSHLENVAGLDADVFIIYDDNTTCEENEVPITDISASEGSSKIRN